jgi:RNA polymerase nonessential primary-like sigma factor
MYPSDFASPAETNEPRTCASASWVLAAQWFFSLTVQYDYLCSGKAHRQSRRVVGERMQRDQTRKQVDNLLRGSGAQDGAADVERAYLNQVAQVPRLSSREEYSLAKRARAGDGSARNALVEANLGLVVMLARRYQRPGVQLLDLIAEGNFGLMAATRGFDPELGFRFPTYAKWAVRRAIERALPRLMTVRQVSIGSGSADDANAPSASDTEINTHSQYAGARFAATPDSEAATATETQAGDKLLRTAQQTVLSDDDALSLLAAPEDQEPPSAAQVLQRNCSLMRAMACLNERERIVINERFALEGCQVATLEQLAQRLHVSIERVRQIECAAVKKLAVSLSSAGESAATLL